MRIQITFNENIPKHKKTYEYLAKIGRNKGTVIADAMELFFEKYGIEEEQNNKPSTSEMAEKRETTGCGLGKKENNKKSTEKNLQTPEVNEESRPDKEPMRDRANIDEEVKNEKKETSFLKQISTYEKNEESSKQDKEDEMDDLLLQALDDFNNS